VGVAAWTAAAHAWRDRGSFEVQSGRDTRPAPKPTLRSREGKLLCRWKRSSSKAGQGKALSLRGTQVAYKAEGQRPAGGPTFLEFTAAPGFNTGDHIHRQIEEIFYVVEGEFQIRAGDRSLRAKPGDFVLVPPGVPHGFANPVGGPAKMVLLISPAGVHERYFEELAAILAKPGPPDVQAIAALRKRYDTEQVSPLST
jgi:mannose-6-phosphate isomerase-like protein (cupin superfamily)